MVSGEEDDAISPDPTEGSQESEPRPIPPVLTAMRIERDQTPDGRAVLYYSWPPRPSRQPSRDVDV